MGIVVLAAAFRFYGLDRLSFWYDEYLSGPAMTGAPSVGAQLQIQRWLGGHVSPLLYGMYYYWQQLVDYSPVGTRLLPLFFGMLGIPLIYLLAKRVGAERAGVFAALLLAFAPLHIWYSHAFRPYAMVMTLGMASTYALLRAIQGDGRIWWFAAATVNVLLVAMQPTDAAFVFAQGCFLLFHLRGRFRASALWVLGQAVFMLPILAYFALGGSTNLDHYMAMNAALLWDFLTNTGISNIAMPVEYWLPNAPATVQQGIHSVFWWAQNTTALLLWATVLLLLYVAFRKRNAPEALRLIAFIAIVPPLVLGVMTAATHLPFMRPRYTLHTYVIGFVYLAVLLSSIPAWRTRYAAYAAATLLVACQSVVLVNVSQHMDWKQAGEHLVENANPGDLLVSVDVPHVDLLKYNEPRIESMPALLAANFQVAIDVACLHTARKNHEDSAVWVLLDRNWSTDVYQPFEIRAAACGFEVDYNAFLGRDHLALFRLRRAPPNLGRTREAMMRYQFFMDREFERVRKVAPEECGIVANDSNAALLSRLTPDAYPFDAGLRPSVLVHLALLGGGEEAMAHFASLSPMNQRLAEALKRAMSNDAASRERALQAAQEPAEADLLSAFIAALSRGDLAEAAKVADRLRRWGMPHAIEAQFLCLQLEWKGPPLPPLGVVPIGAMPETMRPHCGAVATRGVPLAVVNLAETLEFMGCFEEAKRVYAHARMELMALADEVWARALAARVQAGMKRLGLGDEEAALAGPTAPIEEAVHNLRNLETPPQ